MCLPELKKSNTEPQGWTELEHHTTFSSRAVELPRFFSLITHNALQPAVAAPTSSQKQVRIDSEKSNLCSQHTERMISLSFSSPHMDTQIPQFLISGGKKNVALNFKCTQLAD